MKRLDFNLSNNLSQLHDELRAAIPSLIHIRVRAADGLNESYGDDLRVEGNGNDVWLTVADDADEAAIQAVVDAHTPA
jgi:hypothetical protein